MDDFGLLLMLLSMVGAVTGLIGLIKGNIRMLKVANRKQAGLLVLACFAMFIIGSIMLVSGTAESPENVVTVAGDAAQVEQVTGTQDAIEQESETGETIVVSVQPSGSSTTEAEPDSETEAKEDPPSAAPANTTVSGNLEVHFIDVGQADSILIKAPGGIMLIDAGNNADSNLVTSYLKKQGISKLDVVVGTHPHEDHIGGLDAVIDTFAIGKVYMPRAAHTTQTYEDVLVAIKNKGLKITAPAAGTTFDIGEAKCTVLAPNSSSYDDLNNYSIVIKLEYGQTSFLFTGDAEDVSEREMLSKKFDLSADVLKIGHHGSESSTTPAFLDAVNPSFAVIMVGKGNDYGHPHKTVMDRLKAKGVTVYRTDENGTIIATSDGTNISFNTQPGSYSGNSSSGGGSTSSATSSAKSATPTQSVSVPANTDSDRIVYWTPNGKSYHYSQDCRTLSRSKTILSGPLSSCPKDDPCDVCTY